MVLTSPMDIQSPLTKAEDSNRRLSRNRLTQCRATTNRLRCLWLFAAIATNIECPGEKGLRFIPHHHWRRRALIPNRQES
jgi:hypothetical protein